MPRRFLGLVTCSLLAACGPGTGVETTLEPDTTSGDTTGPGPGTGDEPTTTTTTTTTTDTPTTTTDDPSSSTTDPGTGGDPVADCTVLAIADPTLLAAIRDALDVPEGPISGDQALTLTSVDLSLLLNLGGPVTTLAGIECLLGLQQLHLHGTSISDLGPLAPLGDLRSLTMFSSLVADLTPIMHLPLENLAVHNAPLADLGPVAAMSKLKWLQVSHTAVEDLTPLSAHPNLRSFHATAIAPQSLLPLTQIPTLDRIGLLGCGLSSVSELAGASNIDRLELDDNQLTDLTGLAGMKKLTYLSAIRNQISDLDALADLPALATIDLYDNELVTLAPLAGATGLGRLLVSNNLIVDLAPLAGTGVHDLYVDDNPLAGLEGLGSLALSRLSAMNTGLTQLPVIAPQTLRYLELRNNRLTDISALAGHVLLEELYVEHNDIVDLAALEQAPWLLAGCAEFDVRGNPLGAGSLAKSLPAMCEHDLSAKWDQGSCEPPPEADCFVPI